MHQLEQVRIEELMAGYERLVVLAPHPDDEVLGCGGLMMLAAAKFNVVVLSVTDGEASHPDIDPMMMRIRRARERDLALADLQIFGHQAKRMSFADGGVTQALPELSKMLASLTSKADLLVVPWQGDGHPDHEACAAAGLAAQAESGSGLLQYPVWGWHWCEPGQFPFEHALRLELDEPTRAAKNRAMSRFSSQIESDHGQPVLTAATLERFRRPFEVFLK
jgi:LmbE family N-acetylglucosaminyl deacetylase